MFQVKYFKCGKTEEKLVFKLLEQVTCCKHLMPKTPEELATTSCRRATSLHVDCLLQQDLYLTVNTQWNELLATSIMMLAFRKQLPRDCAVTPVSKFSAQNIN